MGENKNIQSWEDADNNSPPYERPGTPERPPYSPLTPTLRTLAPIPGGATIIPPELETSPNASVAAFSTATATASPNASTTTTSSTEQAPRPQNYARRNETGNRRTNNPPPPPPSLPPPTTIIKPEPSPVPISESENADVIAIRSAISLLQLQKQRALNDIQTLDGMKRAAAADPEGFTQELLSGRLTQEDRGFGIINTDLTPVGNDDSEVQEDSSADHDADIDMEGENSGNKSKFGKIPKPQNVVRMPPINWAKYQIVGEPLDKMHEEQRNRPFAGVPRQDPNQRAPEHVIAAPYRPLTDKLEGSPAKGRVKRDRKT